MMCAKRGMLRLDVRALAQRVGYSNPQTLCIDGQLQIAWAAAVVRSPTTAVHEHSELAQLAGAPLAGRSVHCVAAAGLPFARVDFLPSGTLAFADPSLQLHDGWLSLGPLFTARAGVPLEPVVLERPVRAYASGWQQCGVLRLRARARGSRPGDGAGDASDDAAGRDSGALPAVCAVALVGLVDISDVRDEAVHAASPWAGAPPAPQAQAQAARVTPVAPAPPASISLVITTATGSESTVATAARSTDTLPPPPLPSGAQAAATPPPSDAAQPTHAPRPFEPLALLRLPADCRPAGRLFAPALLRHDLCVALEIAPSGAVRMMQGLPPSVPPEWLSLSSVVFPAAGAELLPLALVDGVSRAPSHPYAPPAVQVLDGVLVLTGALLRADGCEWGVGTRIGALPDALRKLAMLPQYAVVATSGGAAQILVAASGDIRIAVWPAAPRSVGARVWLSLVGVALACEQVR